MHNPDDALAALLRPHLDKLYRLAFRLTGAQPDAEDLVQDVLVKVCSRRDELTSIRDLGPWLGRVLFNQFIDDKRRYGRMPLKLVDGEGDGVDAILDETTLSPADAASLDQEQAALQRALTRIAEDQRIVLLLHDAEGYKLNEIAELMDCPAGTVKSRLHRARQRLAELLRPEKNMEPFAPPHRVRDRRS